MCLTFKNRSSMIPKRKPDGEGTVAGDGREAEERVKAVINGVELTQEQLEEGLRQIKQKEEEARRYMPMSGHYFYYSSFGAPDPGVYLAIERNASLLSDEARAPYRLVAIDASGQLTWFNKDSSTVYYTRVKSFYDRTEVQ